MRKVTPCAFLMAAFLLPSTEAAKINADMQIKVPGGAEASVVPIPEVPRPISQCQLAPPSDSCCKLKFEWTRYWYNSTGGICQAVMGSRCCHAHLFYAFETMERCQKVCKVEEKIPEVPKPKDQCKLEPPNADCCRLPLEWTRYWYNSTAVPGPDPGICQAVRGSRCCQAHLLDAFETMEECQM